MEGGGGEILFLIPEVYSTVQKGQKETQNKPMETTIAIVPKYEQTGSGAAFILWHSTLAFKLQQPNFRRAVLTIASDSTLPGDVPK